jgi:hypothetical protein
MPGPDESGKSIEGTNEEKFLAAEYQALIDLDGSRNERLDRFLTIFMTLAAAPWALYALILKDHPGVLSLLTIPSLVAAAFVLTGILGALVVTRYIQVWFTIVLYMRALNAIRGYFLQAETRLSFHLPIRSDKPPYYDKGNYIQLAVAGMAFVNSGYVGLGLFNLVHWPDTFSWRILVFIFLILLCWIGHLSYFSIQARKRESNSRGASLRWGK